MIYKDGGNIKGKRDRRTKNLQKIWVELDGMIKDDDTLAEIIDAKLELNWEMEKEEMYWEQRARANWLRQGDKNTSFFHGKASQRHMTNKIRGLENIDGILKTEDEDMENIIRDYFIGHF